MIGFKRKWIKGECRHLCLLCKHKKECKQQFFEEEKLKQQTGNK